jgi:hypothetical protein
MKRTEGKAMKQMGMLLAVLLALAGETPAAPVRHLEYAFAIYPTAVPNHGYYNGTMSVDILGTAPDGGTLVRASDWWYYTLRPRQAAECEVYASGDVHCDNVPPYPSDSALVLLPLLAHNFFSRGSLAGASSWQQQYTVSFNKGTFVTDISMNLDATPKGDGKFLLVKSKGEIRQRDRREHYALEEGSFVYYPAESVPLTIHDERGHLPTNSIYTRTAVDLRLTKDSAAADATAIQGLPPVQFQETKPAGSGGPTPQPILP